MPRAALARTREPGYPGSMNLRAAAAVLAATLLGCATYPSVPMAGATYQTGNDFSSYRTFDFIPVPPGAARFTASLEHFGIEGVLDRNLSSAGLARSIGGTFGRVQGTPDLLPSDLTGVSPDDAGRSSGAPPVNSPVRWSTSPESPSVIIWSDA